MIKIWGELVEQTNLISPRLDVSLPVIAYGKGVYLYDQAGRKYFDACSGAVTANIGHGVAEMAEIMYEQANRISFVYRSQFTSEPAEKLAKKITDSAGGDLNWCFFVNSGSEATETAMKIAIQHWQEKGMRSKVKVLSRWMSYHGITIGALSMSGHPGRRARFVPLLEDYPVIHPPYCYRCPYEKHPSTCSYPCAQELNTVIKRIGANQIAAFIAEPIIGASGGAITPPPDYYKVIQQICQKHDVLFIADEVMTGFGRTGTLLSIEQWGVVPDIVTLGKGMGAGYAPIAATIIGEHVMAPILDGSKTIMSGHTLSANPQSCAVSLAVLEYKEKHMLIEAVPQKSAYIIKGLKKLQDQFHFIGDVRGRGLLIGVEFVQNKQTKTPFPGNFNLTQKIVEIAQQSGLIIYPAGLGIDGNNGDAILIAPPLTITEAEIDELIELLQVVFQKIEKIIESFERSD